MCHEACAKIGSKSRRDLDIIWRCLGEMCKLRARYGQAVRTFVRTSPGIDQELCKLRASVSKSNQTTLSSL
ncbi:hypothetical protein F2Q68_00020227 [Brassica cretica]|uniref:Uncharacterized protein n=2 Tax=Brassica cretica TaxID=69181 RepID=A0A8S9FP60_BRACR|nr:hypothetical protein F2Q68_00020227 [Brassica cretica]KAF3499074.1 hypothetical protein F2Q69_00041750 [Brassica cretica]KAF3564834.1 hypothetical protein DY000_02013620 [Brassica cretica]